MKWQNAREVTLRTVLELLFIYLCPHWDCRRASHALYVTLVNKPCICSIHRVLQNMQDSYLNRLMLRNVYKYHIVIWFKYNDLFLINSSKLWHLLWHSVLKCKFCFYDWILQFHLRFLHCGNHRALVVTGNLFGHNITIVCTWLWCRDNLAFSYLEMQHIFAHLL